jgi:hypothetical protein
MKDIIIQIPSPYEYMGKIMKEMTEKELEDYFDWRVKYKQYIERYKQEEYNGGFQYWLKIEIRDEKIKELGL